MFKFIALFFVVVIFFFISTTPLYLPLIFPFLCLPEAVDLSRKSKHCKGWITSRLLMRVETKMRPLSQSSAWMLCEPSSKNTTSAGCWHEMAATDHMSIRPCTSHVTDCRELQETRHKAPRLNNYCKKLKKLSRCWTHLVLCLWHCQSKPLQHQWRIQCWNHEASKLSHGVLSRVWM